MLEFFSANNFSFRLLKGERGIKKAIWEESPKEVLVKYHNILRIYKQTILLVIDYGCIVWHECNKSLSDKLECNSIQFNSLFTLYKIFT